MRILLACEGQSEVYLLKNLIRRGYLRFDYPLLLEEPTKMRQLTEIAPIINALPIDERIVIYRVGDTLKDELDLSRFKMREKHIEIHKICTKPELEILVIINENLYDKYLKCSKKMKPKTFINRYIKDYEPKLYFESHDMLNAISKYRKIKRHRKDEKYLKDFLWRKI